MHPVQSKSDLHDGLNMYAQHRLRGMCGACLQAHGVTHLQPASLQTGTKCIDWYQWSHMQVDAGSCRCRQCCRLFRDSDQWFHQYMSTAACSSCLAAYMQGAAFKRRMHLSAMLLQG